MKEFVNRMIKNEERESRVRGLKQLQKRRQCLAKSDKHFGAMAFCKQNAVEFCEPNYLHQQKNEMLTHLALLFGAVAGRMYEPDLREKAESICLSVSVMVSVLILCGSIVSVKL